MAVQRMMVDLDRMQEMHKTLTEEYAKIVKEREGIANLLQRLTNADWRNHDSRRFARHYKKGEEAVSKDLADLDKSVNEQLGRVIAEYEMLLREIEEYYSDPFWKTSQ